MILAILFGLSGCDECVEGESQCTGNGLTSCVRGQFREISFCCVQDGCRDVIVDGLQTAVCSSTGELDPRCMNAPPVGSICIEGPARLHCDAGYSSYERSCAHVCVEPEPGSALCALDVVPDPRCDSSPTDSRCDGNVIVSCAFGYAIAEHTCVAPFDTCTLDNDNLGNLNPRCATALPDAACANDAPGRCNGLDILGCSGGRRTFAHCTHSCYENPIDSMFPEAFCEGPSCSLD